MDNKVKNEIREALTAFLSEQNMSQNDLSRNTGVNASYVSAILAGKQVSAGDKLVEVSDKWFLKIADYIGYKIKKEYWKTQETDQTVRILATLSDAREYGYINAIIGETGCGKSYTARLFANKYKKDVFIVTIGNSDTIVDVLEKAIDTLNIPDTNRHEKRIGSGSSRSRSLKIQRIIRHLKQLKLNGLKPTIIFDESEYMVAPTICMMKEFYDALRGICAIVIIGTDQWLAKLERLCSVNKPGIPQFYSRIKFGIRMLNPIDRSFKLFLSDVRDKALRDFIKKNCKNYREVHDVLVPAMREADRTGEPLSIELVESVLATGGY